MKTLSIVPWTVVVILEAGDNCVVIDIATWTVLGICTATVSVTWIVTTYIVLGI